MNGTIRFIFSLGVAVGISAALSAQPIPLTGHALSHHELKEEMAQAHTPEQYGTLATYFRQKEKLFRDKAAEEKVEWDRRKQATLALGKKYPSSADSARNLYDYYSYKADQMASSAAVYEARAVVKVHLAQ